ncbi:MAG: FBP domain-containing protein [Deltaproteobacteria bacterium]|nr:FBP domain-containing protein [Deltaproteobacteria bacterium]
MFRIGSEEALLEAFRPKDRKQVTVPREMKFPLIAQHYHAWAHPAGGRVFLVFAVKGGVPTGIAFDVDGGIAAVPKMCDWCHCGRLGNQVGLLSARLNAKKTVGVHVCTDLGCKQKLEDAANRGGSSPLPGIERLVARMGRFAEEALGIDLSGAGR